MPLIVPPFIAKQKIMFGVIVVLINQKIIKKSVVGIQKIEN